MVPIEQTLWWQLTPQSHEDGKEDGGWIVEQMAGSCSPTGWAEVPIVTGLVTQGTHGKGILVVTHLFAAVTGVDGLGLCELLSNGNKEWMSHLLRWVALLQVCALNAAWESPFRMCAASVWLWGETHTAVNKAPYWDWISFILQVQDVLLCPSGQPHIYVTWSQAEANMSTWQGQHKL